MPISFSCSQCGKDYLVSDGLAGKKAVCKACNNRMMIPGTAASSPATQRTGSPRAANGPAPAARPVSSRGPAAPTARPVPVARVPEPAEDIYGLDEAPAPLPPMMPRSAGVAEATASEPPVKKKKKKGFFSSGKKASAKSFQYSGVGTGPVRLIAIIVGVVAAAVGGFGLASKSEVEKFAQEVVATTHKATAILQTVHDVGSAGAASAPMKQALEAMIGTFERNRNRKANKRDITEVSRRYRPQIEAAGMQFQRECQRVAMIPGALLALNIQSEISRLEAVEAEAARQGAADGIN
jgi:hypothetical protein